MGLFDKKKTADFGSPIEQVDLGNSQQRPTTTPSQIVPTPSQVLALSQPPPSQPPPQAPALPAQVAPLEPQRRRYGIREAVELMRSLPGENVDLVVQVVKKTLESANIRIQTIIEDAAARQAEIEARVSILRQEIGELDREIAVRKAEISRLDSDHHETTLVKDRLSLAERLAVERSAERPAERVTDRPEKPERSPERASIPPTAHQTGTHPAILANRTNHGDNPKSSGSFPVTPMRRSPPEAPQNPTPQGTPQQASAEDKGAAKAPPSQTPPKK